LKIPPQVFRLVLLTVFIVGSYLLGRFFLRPASFGQYGFYRGHALEEIAAAEPVFAGQQACAECHEEIVSLLAKHEHHGLACESCHGVGRAHVDNPDVKLGHAAEGDCLRCHEKDPSRPSAHKQVESKEHYRGDRCIECHLPHHPSEAPAQ
jgi:hypothetical protein